MTWIMARPAVAQYASSVKKGPATRTGQFTGYADDAAFRPGLGDWPFGRRPPTRAVTTSHAPMTRGGRRFLHGLQFWRLLRFLGVGRQICPAGFGQLLVAGQPSGNEFLDTGTFDGSAQGRVALHRKPQVTRSAEQLVDLALRYSFPRQLRPLKSDTILKSNPPPL